MAVRVRLTARGAPPRMAPACFPITRTPMQAFGNWSQRITAVYGTIGQEAPGPPTARPIPDGPTNGHSRAVPVMYPTWSNVKPSLPRVLPWAGGIAHGIPGVTYTIAGQNPPQDAVVKPAIRVRTGANQGRVTVQPRPSFRWPVQGTRRSR